MTAFVCRCSVDFLMTQKKVFSKKLSNPTTQTIMYFLEKYNKVFFPQNQEIFLKKSVEL